MNAVLTSQPTAKAVALRFASKTKIHSPRTAVFLFGRASWPTVARESWPDVRETQTLADPSDDIRLLRLIAEGEADALAALYDRHAPRLLGLIRLIVSDPELAENVLQEVFLSVWKGAWRFQPHLGDAAVWLSQIARNRAVDALRRRPAKSMGVLEAAGGAHAADASFDRIDNGELAVQVREAMSRLPSEERAAIVLAYFRGWSHARIAQHQTLPVGTVKTRIRNGMGRLRDMLIADEHARETQPRRREPLEA